MRMTGLASAVARSPAACRSVDSAVEIIYRRNDMDHLDSQRDEQQVHLMVSHLIWCPKRRRKVLVHQMGKHCDDLMRQKCDEKGWTILDLAVQPDHVHLF